MGTEPKGEPKRNRSFSLQIPSLNIGGSGGGGVIQPPVCQSNGPALAAASTAAAAAATATTTTTSDTSSGSLSKHSSNEALEREDEFKLDLACNGRGMFDDRAMMKMQGLTGSRLRKVDDPKRTWRKLSVDSILYWGKEALPFVSPSFTLNKSRLRRCSSVKKIKRSRLVQKNGDCNVSHINVQKKERQYIRDIFTTLIDVSWSYLLLIFSGGFVASWTMFAAIYYIICLVHADFENFGAPEWEPCVANVTDFVSVFLFSVESQHTIGYGKRYTTTKCASAITTLCIQSICGLLIQSFMAGLVFAKMARPKKRAETLIFSKNACISLRDGVLCFLFRVGDMRNTHLVQAHVRLQLIKKRVTDEGELLPLQQYDMDVGFSKGLDRIFLVWPITICHVIDTSSPLYDYSKHNLDCAQFEIIVILEGIVESTGMTAQARTSYLPCEISWGHRFQKLVTYQKQNGDYQIDYSQFQKMYQVHSPDCSARELDILRSTGKDICSEYYEQDAGDSENQSNVSSRNPSLDRNCADLCKSNSATLSLLDEQSQPDVTPDPLKADKHFCASSMSFLTPVVAHSKRLLFPHRRNHNNNNNNNNSKHNSYTSLGLNLPLPPEIVVVSPSTPTLISAASASTGGGRGSPSSIQHEIF